MRNDTILNNNLSPFFASVGRGELNLRNGDILNRNPLLPPTRVNIIWMAESRRHIPNRSMGAIGAFPIKTAYISLNSPSFAPNMAVKMTLDIVKNMALCSWLPING